MVGITRRGALLTIGAAGGVAAMAPPSRAAAGTDDVDVAIRLLERYHPGLLRYLDAGGWGSAKEQFRAEYAAGDLSGKYLALSRLTAAIRCSHTHVNPYNLADPIAEQLFGQARLMPVNFTWLGKRMIVTADPHGSGVAPGSEITAIAGRSVAAMLAELLALTRADGSLDNKRRSLLSVGNAERYETFDMLTQSLWPLGETVTIEGSFGNRTVPTISLAQRRAAAPAQWPSDAASPWFRLDRDGRDAVLTMGNWSMFSTKWEWRPWLGEAMDVLARGGTRRLVIDLRGNEGGLSEVGTLLLARLSSRTITPPAQRRMVRYDRVADEDRPYLSTWDKSFYTIGKGLAEIAPGWREVPAGSYGAIAPSGKRFGGRVAVITGAENSSATGIFANLFKTNRLGPLVGGETGRNRRGGNGDAFFFAALPGSKLEMDIPIVSAQTLGSPPDSGDAPDVPVVCTPESIAAGKDLALPAAFAALAG